MLTTSDGYPHLEHGLPGIKSKAGSKVCDWSVGLSPCRGQKKFP